MDLLTPQDSSKMHKLNVKGIHEKNKVMVKNLKFLGFYFKEYYGLKDTYICIYITNMFTKYRLSKHFIWKIFSMSIFLTADR